MDKKVLIIYQKCLNQLLQAERRRLNYLTLKGNADQESMMRSDVLRRKKNLQQVQVFIALLDGVIVGWSATVSGKVYTYVMRSCRRLGIGSDLLAHASNWLWNTRKKKATVLAWDDGSAEFFSICESRQLPVNVVTW